MITSFNARVGIGGTFGTGPLSSHASFTTQVRAQMENIINTYRNFVEHIEDMTPEILEEALLPTFEKSLAYCPRDTGRMADSGYLETQAHTGVVSVEMGYGRGGEPPYTVFQHENLDFHHEPPTRAKWLQGALEEDADDVSFRIFEGYVKAAGTGGAGG